MEEKSIENANNEPEANSKWIDAYYDPVASLYTFTQCMSLSDISADGDTKLVIADLGTGSYDIKLKVYRGTNLLSENILIDLPTGVATLYMDNNEPRTPAIAVASGASVFVYKNLRPYFKFVLPSMPINGTEEELWKQIKSETVPNVDMLRDHLDRLQRDEGVELTARSQHFLRLAPYDRLDFVNAYKDTPLKNQTTITCLDTLKKSVADDDAISCLLLGTESKQIYVLDPEAFTILAKMDLPAVPVFLSSSGLFTVEYRIIAACRNGGIYIFQRDTTTAKLIVELESQIVGVQRIGKNIYVGCMDDTLRCFSAKGRMMWSIVEPASIVTLEVMENRQKGYRALLVSLSNCEVRVYRERFLSDTLKTPAIVNAMRFGRFGREESTLIMVTKGGGLLIKMLKRTANMEEKDVTLGPPPAQNIKLDIPKKTKLFVDQTLRERENAPIIHRQFQHDLYRLRLETARNYVKALTGRHDPISTTTQEPLRLSAQVQGIGPTFKMIVNLQNTSLNQAVTNLLITFQFDDCLYNFQRNLIHVPLIVPGLNYPFEIFVMCKSDKPISDNVKVYVVKKGSSIPIITAVISMPVSETMIVV